MNLLRLHRASGRLLRGGRIRRVATSVSDNDTYPQFCLDAAADYGVFETFRRERVYTKILEHVTREQGEEYLSLLSEDRSLLEAMPEFARNDEVGSPLLYDYPGVGSVSSTTLRYVKVLGDLKRLFGSLDGMRIAEIGVGYGGQCRVINAAYTPAEYSLIDLQPALALTQRYLDHFVLSGPVAYRTMNELVARDYDLVISNYAYTELPRPLQDCYYERVLKHSARGYITYNDVNPGSFDSYGLDEFRDKLDGVRIEPERPLTHPKNCVVCWGGG